jgi:hypothetical protein
MTLLAGARADTPRPVTANTEPAKGCCFFSSSESPNRDVVTYRMSKLGPPNVTDVTRLAGIGTASIRPPVSGSTLITYKIIIFIASHSHHLYVSSPIRHRSIVLHLQSPFLCSFILICYSTEIQHTICISS